jgi:acyl-CoA thioesterase FadM
VFSARVVYVSVDLRTHAPVETPREIREFMGEAIDLVGARTTGQ